MDDRERWRSIKDFPGYRVSSRGRVKSNLWGYWHVMRGDIDSCGYPVVRLRDEETGRGHTKNVHRLVAKAFLPNKENLRDVNHKDGIKTNNSVDNLEWVSHSDNMYHAFAHGLNHSNGHGHVKVRVVETGEIFDSEADCARALGISQPNICGCLLHKYGRHTCNGFHFEYVDE